MVLEGPGADSFEARTIANALLAFYESIPKPGKVAEYQAEVERIDRVRHK